MVQIKRAFNPQSKTTTKGATANQKSGSFHDRVPVDSRRP